MRELFAEYGRCAYLRRCMGIAEKVATPNNTLVDWPLCDVTSVSFVCAAMARSRLGGALAGLFSVFSFYYGISWLGLSVALYPIWILVAFVVRYFHTHRAFAFNSTPCSLNTGGMERFGCNLSQRRRGKGCGGARWFRSHHPSSHCLDRWKLHCPFGVAWLWSCKVLLRPEIFQFFFVYLSPPLQDNIFQWLFNACVGRACPGWSVVGCVGTLDNGICLERNTRSALRSQTHHKRVQTAHPLTFD